MIPLEVILNKWGSQIAAEDQLDREALVSFDKSATNVDMNFDRCCATNC
jgi:hypothetical protein